MTRDPGYGKHYHGTRKYRELPSFGGITLETLKGQGKIRDELKEVEFFYGDVVPLEGAVGKLILDNVFKEAKEYIEKRVSFWGFDFELHNYFGLPQGEKYQIEFAKRNKSYMEALLRILSDIGFDVIPVERSPTYRRLTEEEISQGIGAHTTVTGRHNVVSGRRKIDTLQIGNSKSLLVGLDLLIILASQKKVEKIL